MARQLKVYRTPIGFHDAYVAAVSQKAALQAWGTDTNLFAAGIAEQVNDEELAREPLAQPGVVVRRLRGTTAEQLAALPPDRPQATEPDATAPSANDIGPAAVKKAPRASASKTAGAEQVKSLPRAKPLPKPDKTPLEQIERELTAAEDRHRRARADLAAREAALARERRDIDRDQGDELDDLRARMKEAEGAYDRALREWRRRS